MTGRVVTAVVVVSLLARPTVGEAPTEAAETARDLMSSVGAGGASCTHPFVNPKYATGNRPLSVAIGDLDGVNGPDLAVANESDDNVSVLLNLCDPCPWDLDDDGEVGSSDLRAIIAAWGNKGGPEDLDGNGIVDFGDLLVVLAAWGPCE